MSIYTKLADAQAKIKASDLKKGGHNDYSNYDYFTPEQISLLVSEACKEYKLFLLFDMKRNELGIYGELVVVDLDIKEDRIVFTMAAMIPEIKATNGAQQLGGAMTYTKRYMLMNAFDIVDNTLDFDHNKKPAKTPPPPQQKKPQQKAPANRGSEIPNKGQQNAKPQPLKMATKKDVDALVELTKAGHYARAKAGLKYWETDGRGITTQYKKMIIDLMFTLSGKTKPIKK